MVGSWMPVYALVSVWSCCLQPLYGSGYAAKPSVIALLVELSWCLVVWSWSGWHLLQSLSWGICVDLSVGVCVHVVG